MSVAEGNMSCVPATTMAVELPPDGHEEEVSSQPQEKEKEAVDCSLATGVAAAFERLARERARLLDAAGVVDEVTTTAQPQLQLQPQPQLQPHSKYFTKAMKIRVEAVPQFDALELAELRKQASIPEFISDEKLAQKVRELVGAASRAACAASSSTTLRGGKNVEHPLRQPCGAPRPEATTVVLHVFIVHPVKCFKQLLDELDTKSFRSVLANDVFGEQATALSYEHAILLRRA